MILLLTSLTALLLSLTTASPTPLNLPLSQSCSPASFTNITTFPLQEYLIETVTTPRDNGIQGATQTLATFSVKNPGSGDTYRLFRIPISVGGGVWSTCIAGDTPLPAALKRCQYLLERRAGGRVGFRFQWVCEGGEGGKPLVFDATMIGDLPKEVCAPKSGTDGVTQSCGLDVKEVALEVANIYWDESAV